MLLSVFYYITCGQCLGEINSQLGEKHFAALFFTKFSRDLQPFWRIFSKFNLLRSRDFHPTFQKGFSSILRLLAASEIFLKL